MSDGLWPFDQPRNCAVFTMRQIIENGSPVLLVTHDEDDHGWQFLDGSDSPDLADALLVSLERVVNADPSLYEIADLSPGWIAWRKSPDTVWTREPRPAEWGDGN